MSVTTRISDRAKRQVERLAEEKGISQQEVLDKALEVYERECFLESVNAGAPRSPIGGRRATTTSRAAARVRATAAGCC